MDKEQILSEIKTRVGQIRLSDRTLTDYVSAHLPEGEPMMLITLNMSNF